MPLGISLAVRLYQCLCILIDYHYLSWENGDHIVWEDGSDILTEDSPT